MKHLLCLLVTAVFAFTGCNQGREMMKPVIQEVVTDDTAVVPTTEDTIIDVAPSAEELTQEEMNAEEPTPEEGTAIADIFADIDLPPEPTIPEGADVLDTDRVFHATTEDFLEGNQLHGRIDIQAGENPSQNESVIAFFQESRAWAEEFCGKAIQGQVPRLDISFKFRAEREAFKDSLPGGWTESVFDKETWWYIHVENTLIIDSTDVYYTMLFNVTDPCVFRN